ncbi:SGNH/GDSL hydrolase family protein [Streptomyces sp. NPDC006798]|uniref:SGNH/GDSL hydrolase family protein n=1 Tax=Streptomyces sp. NPDC006798 TaxID=3155462 RepID=UPI0033F1C425
MFQILPFKSSPAGGGFARRAALAALAALTLALPATVTTSAASAAPASAAAPVPLAAAEPVQWAALGDSYTAGVFVGDPRPALGSPDRDGCDRTTGSYPNLVAAGLAAEPPAGRPVELTDVSCGAAVIGDIATVRQTPISPVEPPEGGWPSVAPQVDRAELNADTDVVTIGVGGNSLPFGKIFVSCLVAGFGQPDDATPCKDAYETGESILDPESISDKYDRVVREYAAMLRDVHQKAPDAKIVTVGYPTIVPADATTCDRQDTTELAADIKGLGRISATHGDIAWLNEVSTRFNDIIRAVTELSGDTYVDIAASSVGHDLCRPRGTKWVEGVCGEAGSYWPDEVSVGIFTLTCSDGNRATVVHPNAAGYRNTAVQVEAAVREALT